MVTLLLLLTLLDDTPKLDIAPLATTKEMQRWAEHAAVGTSPTLRWQRLGVALTHDLRLAETPLRTPTAHEAFTSRQVNCVGFAHLAVALARSVGIDAYFVLVEIDPRTIEAGDLRVVEQHLAAGFGRGAAASTLDLDGWRLAERGDRPISDRTARAIFLSNRGAELLLADAPDEARTWLRAAIDVDPSLVQTWVNLGVAERRSGRPRLAALAYYLALLREPQTASARGNLAVLRGRSPTLADELGTLP
ncbi:MAG: transglutaminase domain-containing protein [Acidobacteriota bacterium]